MALYNIAENAYAEFSDSSRITLSQIVNMGGVVGFTTAFTTANSILTSSTELTYASTYTSMGFGIFVLNCDSAENITFLLVGEACDESYSQTYTVTNVNSINIYSNWTDEVEFSSIDLSSAIVYGSVISETTLTNKNLMIVPGTAAGFRDSVMTINLDATTNDLYASFLTANEDFEFPFVDVSHRQVVINNIGNHEVELNQTLDLQMYKRVTFNNGFELKTTTTTTSPITFIVGEYYCNAASASSASVSTSTDTKAMIIGSNISLCVINTFSNTRNITVNPGGKLSLGQLVTTTSTTDPSTSTTTTYVRTPLSVFTNTGTIEVNGALAVF